MNPHVKLENKVVLSDIVIEEFATLLELSRDTQFMIGDRLILYVRRYDGNLGGVINALAGELRISPSTLYDYHRVATVWSPEYREIYQSLDWTIYRNANPNNPEDVELLNKAIDEGWTATAFKEEKYSRMKDPSYVVDRIEAIIKRSSKFLSKRLVTELEFLLGRIRRVLSEESVG